MPSPISIRTARPSDVETLLRFWDANAERSHADDHVGVGPLLDRDPDALLVAVDGEEIVGALIAGWDGWRGHMYRLAVAPERRREGIALALVRAGEERFRALGVQRIIAPVVESSDVATGFWRAAGYEVDARIARFAKML
jgi:ribosomal protein S18 acetylase RimI-like enzyme